LTTTKSGNSPGGNLSGAANPAALNPRYLHWKRRFAHLARWLHTYLSMLSFAILLFFAVTGLTLNHAEWFDAHARPARVHGALNKQWVNASNPDRVSKDDLVRYFRQTHHIKGALSDLRVDGDQCEILFKGPGYAADATIDRATGSYDLTISPFSAVALLNDLHKGRDAGKIWSDVIDFSAVLMTLVSLTGLTLIFFLNKRRISGLLVVVIGAAICWLVYSLWVS
jgi:uncharacterized protein